jgi:hypothetical protein
MSRRRFDLEQLPSNNKLISNDRGVRAVTTGRVKQRSSVYSNVRNIGNSLFEDIVIPAIKSVISDFFSNALNMALFGESSTPASKGSRRPYHRMYERRGVSNRHTPTKSARVEVMFEDVLYDTREDAELVLGRLLELIAEYDQATIGDLYSLVGLQSNYTHERYGWFDLSRSRVHFTSDGYLIDLPEPEHLR